jgi:hypothetical protein
MIHITQSFNYHPHRLLAKFRQKLRFLDSISLAYSGAVLGLFFIEYQFLQKTQLFDAFFLK